MTPRHLTPAGDVREIVGRYQFANWDALFTETLQEISWLVPGFLEVGTVNSLYGGPGAGKSLFALDMAARLAAAGTVVLYVDHENRLAEDIVAGRLRPMWYKPADLVNLRFLSYASLPPLDAPLGGIHLTALAEATGAELVVLDTTSRMISGGENDSDTFLKLYRCSLMPLKARGVTVLRLDHPGKNEERGQRGSSAKNGDVDSIWKMTQPTRLTRLLECEKTRSGSHAEGFSIQVRLDPLRHEMGEPGQGTRIDEIMKMLDDAGMLPGTGRNTVRDHFKEIGFRCSNDELATALRLRKHCPETDRTDIGGPDSQSPAAPLSVRTSYRYGQRTGTGPGQSVTEAGQAAMLADQGEAS